MFKVLLLIVSMVGVSTLLTSSYHTGSLSDPIYYLHQDDDSTIGRQLMKLNAAVPTPHKLSGQSLHSVGDNSTNRLFDESTATGDAEFSPSFNTERECDKTLKVFMYDLPRRFNLGLLRTKDANQSLPWPENDLPIWAKSGLSKQHNVEYWMMMSLLGDQTLGAENRSAVRVKDPINADVFFVPFFSSVSFNMHSHKMRDPVSTEQDKNLQAELVEFLTASKWWQRSGGRDHVIVIHHPNAFRFFKDRLNASIFIVADFWRFSKRVARLSKDVVAPYTHMVSTYHEDEAEDPFGSRTILLFFQGRIFRKDDGFVRAKLARILRRTDGVHFRAGTATPNGVAEVTKGMRSSKFCLHPAGDTPSACRLFDAIVSHCVPVIVSDRIELPFEDELDYKEFCLFFSVADALKPDHLLRHLQNFDKDLWLKMWRRLREVSHHFEYQYPLKKDDAVNMVWKQVRGKLPAVKLAIHRRSRLMIPDWGG
ncbi:hypothetical protein O6H91_06G031500 [Diphasiastrum complanatum]|uniref:Uncharacterized protein n=3 Tax=Diphasiastrum complanatum TaxID=34168 RepID=A0ACC2DC97_DIPCM|nr:hypothetical protein O6H91_06G030000 [Diphasiastrum complanatum]KAJ7551843.1 hypothetical protein O6H91_06G031500 [Diphasiastrum complanatum]KAJ7551844.1 hypothetical protein O6H91_06G031500 [Diphasiastrum complanatum]